MDKPQKPNYTDAEIREMNLKLEEQNRKLSNLSARDEYVRKNLSSKSNWIITVEGAMRGLYYALQIIIFMYATHWMLFTVLKVQTSNSLSDGIFTVIVSIIAGFYITIFSSIILSFISATLEKLFNPIHKVIENEKNQLIEQYQLNITNKYEKYAVIEKELNNYNRRMIEYEEYCKRINESFWYNLDGHEFEQEIARLFRKEGYYTRVSKIGADGGIDITLTKDGKRYAVQCKAHNKKISEGVARDLYGVLHAKNYDGGYLVTLNGVSSKTHQFCQKIKDKPIIIWTIKTILKKYSE